MGKSRSNLCPPPSCLSLQAWPLVLCLLLLLLLLLLPVPAQAFDVSSLLAALGGGGKKEPAQCPTNCNCTARRAEDVMQDYLTRYLPSMGRHMQPELERQARATVTVFTSWIGSMTDIQCRVPDGEKINLTFPLGASTLSFKSLKLVCGVNSTVVWDVSPLSFLSILDISGCNLEKAAGVESLSLPMNLWVLELDAVPAQAVQSLDLTASHALLALSITNSSLTALPAHWAGVTLYRIMVMRLGHNKLSNYTCEIKTFKISSLNLDHNNMTSVPPCLIDGTEYANHVSLRHNSIRSLEGLLVNKSEDKEKPTPYVYYLDLAHNKLDSVPALRKVNAFFSFDVSHNSIHTIAVDAFASSQLLTWLDLSNNRLEHIPDEALSTLPLLNHLNISHNLLRSFDFDQSPLSTKVVTLDLRYNRLMYPPFADTGFVAPRLSRISAGHNPFRCDCKLHVFLEFLAMLNSSRQHWFSLGYWDLYEHDPSINQPYVDVQGFTCSQPAEMKDVPFHTLSFKSACPVMNGCPAECRCELKKGERQHVSVDCSRKQSLTVLPAEVPLVANASLVLYVNRSGLRRLEHRPYLHHVSEMYASYSKVSAVTPGAMEALKNVRVLSLDNNQLKSLPAVTQNLTLTAATNISLANNPWTCGCHDVWMADWLTRHKDVLGNVNKVQCRWTGKMVTELNAADLNCEFFNYLPLVVALSVLLASAIILASLLVKYKLEVLVFLYTRFRVRPFDMYKYDSVKAFQFDVFVSFSQHDYHWVVEKLVDQLENRPRPYKLCIHLRDFPVGVPIADSVSWAVNSSRCTLLVMTKDFLASEWCRHEFRAAHARLLKDRQARLLIVVHGPVDARKLDRELLAYLRTNTYLKTDDKWFWAKLEYALPHPQDSVVVLGGEEGDGGGREGENGGPPPAIELDTILPVALAAGDVFPTM